MILDVGCGYLPSHKRYAGKEHIGIDVKKGACNVVCSVTHLPFRNDTYNYVFARNILEHLTPNDLRKALLEIKRVMTQGAIIDITIPIYHNVCLDELIKIVVGFPLRFVLSFLRLLRWRKHWHTYGFRHLNRIRPQDLVTFFQPLLIVKTRHKHPINYIFPLRWVKVVVWLTPHIYHIFAFKKFKPIPYTLWMKKG